MANYQGSGASKLREPGTVPARNERLRLEEQQEAREGDPSGTKQEGLCLDSLRIIRIATGRPDPRPPWDEDNVQPKEEPVLDGRNIGSGQQEIFPDIQHRKRTPRGEHHNLVLPIFCWLFLVFYAKFLVFLGPISFKTAPETHQRENVVLNFRNAKNALDYVLNH